jgi:FkbM family methyltransferase
MSEFYLRIKDDILVGVPSSVTNLTTYVLIEQEDWFEKEIGFLRRWLRPGMRAIDIGANYGVYALSMAKAIGPNGHVCAFEPTRATAAALSQSITKNGLDNLHVRAVALSNREGMTRFHTYPNSEMNSLHRIAGTVEPTIEEVAVSTLDQQYQTLGWSTADFVKIDTEGEELNVLDGGRRFFSEQSPLVMFEIPCPRKDGDIAPLLGRFRDLGYGIYRLIGPDTLLVPVASDRNAEFFEINLFACKPDRATELAAAGLLIGADDVPSISANGDGQALFGRQLYASAFGPLGCTDELYRSALDAYATWRDPAAPSGARVASVARSLMLVQQAAKARPTLARLSSLARIALEAGERKLAMDTIEILISHLLDAAQPPDEPFFPGAPRYDTIDPQGAARSWLLAATFEAGERNRFHSGYFQPWSDMTADLHEWLARTPFRSPAMERRRQLLRLFNGKQSKLQAAPILTKAAPDNLNSQFWQRQG